MNYNYLVYLGFGIIFLGLSLLYTFGNAHKGESLSDFEVLKYVLIPVFIIIAGIGTMVKFLDYNSHMRRLKNVHIDS